jgi:ATP-dependent DNA helicase RecQ
LAKEDILSYNEIFFKPATLVFIVSKTDLEEFQVQHPELTELIKGLLRTYEGIFDYPSTIYETAIARFLKMPIGDVNDGLAKLNYYKIVQYRPQNDKPQIFLLKNRMYSDDFKIDLKAHEKRKEAYSNRVKAMLDFVYDRQNCRSSMLANYFGDMDIKPCNICDNCISNKPLNLSAKEFSLIEGELVKRLEEKHIHINDLELIFKKVNKEKLHKVIDFMRSEEKIVTDKNGFVFLK